MVMINNIMVDNNTFIVRSTQIMKGSLMSSWNQITCGHEQSSPGASESREGCTATQGAAA